MMTTTMNRLSEDEHRFYHYQPTDCAIIYCDTSDKEEDNAFQQTTNSAWPTEVDIVKEPSEAQGSQSQAAIMMTTDAMMIDGGVSSPYASSNSNRKRDLSSPTLQLSASSSSDLSVAMTGNANNKNVRTSYVPHMRTRTTRNTDLVCITSIIILPSSTYHLSSLYYVITGQSSESPGRTEQ